MRQRFENSGTFLNEATRLLILVVALHPCGVVLGNKACKLYESLGAGYCSAR